MILFTSFSSPAGMYFSRHSSKLFRLIWSAIAILDKYLRCTDWEWNLTTTPTFDKRMNYSTEFLFLFIRFWVDWTGMDAYLGMVNSNWPQLIVLRNYLSAVTTEIDKSGNTRVNGCVKFMFVVVVSYNDKLLQLGPHVILTHFIFLIILNCLMLFNIYLK